MRVASLSCVNLRDVHLNNCAVGVTLLHRQQARASGGADRITQFKPPAQLFAVTGYCSFKNHTQKDNSHQELIKVIEAGWPQTKGELPHLVLPFFDVRDELCVCNGIIRGGGEVVVPKSLRQDMLYCLHYAHSGVVSTLSLARESIYWQE